MREVINNQMEMFSQSLNEESGQPACGRLEGEGQSVSMETSKRLGRSDTSYREYRSQYNNDRKHRSRSSSRGRSYKRCVNCSA